MLYDILAFIRQERTVGEAVLAQHFGIDRTTLQPIVQRLIQKKLIQATPLSTTCASTCISGCQTSSYSIT
jgi:hypothetical protein